MAIQIQRFLANALCAEFQIGLCLLGGHVIQTRHVTGFLQPLSGKFQLLLICSRSPQGMDLSIVSIPMSGFTQRHDTANSFFSLLLRGSKTSFHSGGAVDVSETSAAISGRLFM